MLCAGSASQVLTLHGLSMLQEAVRTTAGIISQACNGLLEFLQQVSLILCMCHQSYCPPDTWARPCQAFDSVFALVSQVQRERSGDGQQQSFRRQLAEAVKDLETIDWLVPPMLQAR